MALDEQLLLRLGALIGLVSSALAIGALLPYLTLILQISGRGGDRQFEAYALIWTFLAIGLGALNFFIGWRNVRVAEAKPIAFIVLSSFLAIASCPELHWL